MRKALAAKTTRVPQRAKLARPLPLPPAPKIREDLSVEFFSLVRLALAKFGVTGAEQERAIRLSNVALVCATCGPVRVGHEVRGDKKVRVCKKCGTTLDK